MIGTHSKEELLAELKGSCSNEQYAKLKQDIEDKVAEYKGKYKDFPKIEVAIGIVYYPKDGSFSLEKI
jgi:hypothetical protein